MELLKDYTDLDRGSALDFLCLLFLHRRPKLRVVLCWGFHWLNFVAEGAMKFATVFMKVYDRSCEISRQLYENFITAL